MCTVILTLQAIVVFTILSPSKVRFGLGVTLECYATAYKNVVLKISIKDCDKIDSNSSRILF